jgi:hypothetical protein
VIAAAVLADPRAAAAADDVMIELHFKPVANTQIAIWLEDKDGKWVQDVLVTQATGKLGIGNRPGIWNFVSSWRAPYGPRVSVLPIWANRRGKLYPKIRFHDSDPGDFDSLGWHESTSSAERYYCRPLTASEHETISVDTMTCPSPNVFQTDKGRFDGDAKSPYPPRNDLTEFEQGADSPDTAQYAALNDLDAVTEATPAGDQPTFVLAQIPAEVAASGPVTAWIEVNLEHDENQHFDFDRENDHYVDWKLENYGVEYLGQPSVVYKVTFDPRGQGFLGTSDYAGYGDWDGASGTVHPPDGKISTNGGSGADRLRQYTKNGETFRFGVYSYGGEGGDTDTGIDPDTGVDPDTGDTGTDDTGGDTGTGTGSGTGDTGGDDDGGGWGQCRPRTLPPIAGLELEGLSFDKVRVHYTIPAQSDPNFELAKLRVYHLLGETPLTDERLSTAYEYPPWNGADLTAPGEPGNVQIDQLWGNYTYQIGVTYEDRCGNTSPVVAQEFTTEAQKFQQVEGFCFLATAAYGAAWAPQVQALRYFRDAYLKVSPIGRDLVRFYYTYSPPLARVVHHQPLLRGMVRVVVQPVADLAGLSRAPRG